MQYVIPERVTACNICSLATHTQCHIYSPSTQIRLRDVNVQLFHGHPWRVVFMHICAANTYCIVLIFKTLQQMIIGRHKQAIYTHTYIYIYIYYNTRYIVIPLLMYTFSRIHDNILCGLCETCTFATMQQAMACWSWGHTCDTNLQWMNTVRRYRQDSGYISDKYQQWSPGDMSRV